jgi:hypothetical protein
MNFKKLLNSKILLFLLIILIILLSPSFYDSLKEKKFLEEKANNLIENIERMNKENRELEEKVIALKGDEESDKILRKMYVLKKEGEEVLIIPQELLRIENEEKKQEKNIFEKIKDIFLRD